MNLAADLQRTEGLLQRFCKESKSNSSLITDETKTEGEAEISGRSVLDLLKEGKLLKR